MQTMTTPPAEENGAEKKVAARRTCIKKGIAAAICAAAGLAFTLAGIFMPNKPLTGFGMIFFIPAVILLLCIINNVLSLRNPPRSVMPYAAVVAALSCLPLGFIVMLMSYGDGIVFLIALPIILCTLSAPIIGITMGIITLCGGVKKYGKAGVASGIAAVVIPFIIAGTIILLMSARVIVITLM